MSTRVIVTGGAGFIGTLLARRLLAKPVTIGDARPAPVDELVLVDLVAPPPDVAADPRVRAVTGDLAGAADELEDADAIFHLAGVVSGAAEADFDLGMRVNLDGTRAVLEPRQAAPDGASAGVLKLARGLRRGPRAADRRGRAGR